MESGEARRVGVEDKIIPGRCVAQATIPLKHAVTLSDPWASADQHAAIGMYHLPSPNRCLVHFTNIQHTQIQIVELSGCGCRSTNGTHFLVGCL